MSNKEKIQNYAKALLAIDRSRELLDQLEDQILEDTNADIDITEAISKLIGLKTQRESILIALVESQRVFVKVKDTWVGGSKVDYTRIQDRAPT
ncbi:hypothetical protein [Sutterella wadsworthensis]|uniref:hypothetical protein n=1 Tax=Sutterella wadsworthensis TaxID=40545 RepID=UPI00307E2177